MDMHKEYCGVAFYIKVGVNSLLNSETWTASCYDDYFGDYYFGEFLATDFNNDIDNFLRFLYKCLDFWRPLPF